MRLLEEIAAHGSIAAAGRALGMSYRRAWRLVEAMNAGFGRPVVEAQVGGRAGGGARLSPFGTEVAAQYRAIEAAAAAAAAPFLARLAAGGGDASPPGPGARPAESDAGSAHESASERGLMSRSRPDVVGNVSRGGESG